MVSSEALGSMTRRSRLLKIGPISRYLDFSMFAIQTNALLRAFNGTVTAKVRHRSSRIRETSRLLALHVVILRLSSVLAALDFGQNMS